MSPFDGEGHPYDWAVIKLKTIHLSQSSVYSGKGEYMGS
jgi:hypothetical protein